MLKSAVRIFVPIFILVVIATWETVCHAQNPVVQMVFTADPAPLVHNGTLYMYTGQDEDDAQDNRYLMHYYRCYATRDMVNWTDLGVVIDVREVFAWSGGDANAAQCIYRNGKFYYYVSTGNTKGPGGVALGVAVSDSPSGPFVDALGHALVTNDQTKYADHSWDDLDPTVFIDDDGRAFLYWGNNACYYAELNDDMISLKSEIAAIPLEEATIGPDFEEAPWTYKRDGIYYLVYASGFPESIHYSTSAGPTGPWMYRGQIMGTAREDFLNTIHPGVIDYKGHSYFFYHSAALPNGGDKRRSVCIEQFAYNPDGTIPSIQATDAGIVNGLANLDPFVRVEAETMAWGEGVETEKDDAVGVYVTDVDSGDYIKVRDVDFGAGRATSFHAGVSGVAGGGTIELRLDDVSGTVIGTLNMDATGGSGIWDTQSCDVNDATGVHDLFLVFKGTGDPEMKIDWWMIK